MHLTQNTCTITLGSWTKAPPLLLGGSSPVVAYLRHSMIVWYICVCMRVCEQRCCMQQFGCLLKQCACSLLICKEQYAYLLYFSLNIIRSYDIFLDTIHTVFPAPFCPVISVRGVPNCITALSCPAAPKLRMPAND